MLNIFLTILSNGTVDTTSSFGSALEFANFYNFTSKADVCDKTLSSSCDSFNLVSLLIFLLEIFFNESYEQCFSCLTSNSFFSLETFIECSYSSLLADGTLLFSSSFTLFAALLLSNAILHKSDVLKYFCIVAFTSFKAVLLLSKIIGNLFSLLLFLYFFHGTHGIYYNKSIQQNSTFFIYAHHRCFQNIIIKTIICLEFLNSIRCNDI